MPDSALAKALIEFHKELPDVGKGSTNPAFGSKYADLADIVKVVLPALAKHNLAWIARPTYDDGVFVLAYELRHTSGDSITGSWPLPDPTKAKQQEMGSAVTYAKRYALSAVTGIAPDADDDGNAASARGTRGVTARPAAADRITKAETALRATTDRASLDKVWGDVRVSGLDGIANLKATHDELDKLYPASTVDEWATLEVPK